MDVGGSEALSGSSCPIPRTIAAAVESGKHTKVTKVDTEWMGRDRKGR